MGKTIYSGKVARDVCNMLLSNGNDGSYETPIEGRECLSAGYWQEDGKWIAYDNTDGCCWVEEFKTRQAAVEWIKG